MASEIARRVIVNRPGWRVYLLTRDPSRIAPFLVSSRFTVFRAALDRPDLGLKLHQARSLRASVKEVIHCATDRRPDRSLDQMRAANVQTTDNLIRFASDCPLLTRFLHLSTTYVAGRSVGQIPEALISHRARFSNTYQQSKFEAEHLVSSYANRFPIVIARLTSIAGDSQTGFVRQFNHVHQLLKLYPRCPVPVIPSDPNAIVDLIATDWTASALVYLFHHQFVPGAVWHLCASAANGAPLDALLADAHRVFAVHPSGQRFLPITPPRLGTLRDWEDYVERLRLTGTAAQNDLARTLNYFLPHLAIPQVFENHLTMDLLRDSGLAQPAVRPLHAGVVRWCLDTNWGEADHS